MRRKTDDGGGVDSSPLPTLSVGQYLRQLGRSEGRLAGVDSAQGGQPAVDHEQGQVSGVGHSGWGGVHEVVETPILLGVPEVELDLEPQAIIVTRPVIASMAPVILSNWRSVVAVRYGCRHCKSAILSGMGFRRFELWFWTTTTLLRKPFFFRSDLPPFWRRYCY